MTKLYQTWPLRLTRQEPADLKAVAEQLKLIEQWGNEIDVPVVTPAVEYPIICTSATRPTTGLFRGMTIFETDTGALLVYYGATTLWAPPWNQPWGAIGSALTTTSQGAITNTEVDLTSLSVAWTSLGNRQVEVFGMVHVSSTVANDQFELKGTTAANVTFQGSVARVQTITANRLYVAPISGKANVAVGANTMKLRGLRVVGTGTHTIQNATITGHIRVNDIGPNGNPPAT